MKSRFSEKRILVLLGTVMLISLFLTLTCFATGNVAGAVESTWSAAKDQIKQIVNNVVFPVVDLTLAVLFFVKVATSYFDYKKHGQFEWTAPAILFGTLVFALTAPLYVWDIIGM